MWEWSENFRDSENNEIRDFPISVNMTHVNDNREARTHVTHVTHMAHVNDNREARNKKTYADVVKLIQTQSLVSENRSNHVNEMNGDQVDIKK